MESFGREWVLEVARRECGQHRDLGDVVERLMRDKDVVGKVSNGDQLANLFELLIDTFESRTIHEEEDEYALRRRDVATEHAVSYANFVAAAGDNSFDFREKYAEADLLMKQNCFGKAFNVLSDAVFVAEMAARAVSVPTVAAPEDEDDDDPSCPKMVSPKEVYLDLRLKQVECLHCDGQHRKAAVYANWLLHWMTSQVVMMVPGFLASAHPDKFSLLQIWQGEAEVALGEYRRAVEGCSRAISNFCALKSHAAIDRNIFSVRQTFFEKLKEHLCEDDGSGEECSETDGRSGAKIVVSETREKGVDNGQFVVNDLQSALRIAKDGDVIFLEAGNYCPAKKEGKKATFEVRKTVTLVGSGPSRSVICGSLVKWGPGTLVLKNLKLEVGVDIDDDDDVYLMEGNTVIDSCVVESPVNTCFFVISQPHQSNSTRLELRNCILDGMENCRRFICFQGPFPTVIVDSCYVSDLYSFLTVISPLEVSRGVVTVANSVLYDCQDGLKIVVHHDSTVTVRVIGCQLEVAQSCEQGSPSHAFSLTGGSCFFQNNLVSLGHIDSIGLSLHSLRRADVDMNLIECEPQQPRALALGEGVVLSENVKTYISGTEVVGTRVGFRISNRFDEVNEVILRDCGAKSCSVGLYVEKKNGDASSSSSSDTNLELTVAQSHFQFCHYGLLNEDWRTRTEVFSCSFSGVARPVLVSKINPFKLTLRTNEFENGTPELDVDVDDDEEEEVEGEEEDADERSQRMFMYLATKENLAHRMAVDLRKFVQVGTVREENLFYEKYHLFRTAKSE